MRGLKSMKQVELRKIIEVINKTENVEILSEHTDDNLTELGMDSITFIQIVVGLEETFDCEIPDDKLLISEMDSVQKIYNVLEDLYQKQSV